MKLTDWKAWKGYDLEQAAKVLDISPSFLSLLLRDKRSVSPSMALQIEQKTEKAVRKEELLWPED